MTADTTSRAFFEGKYQASADPWNFASSQYELARYEAIINATTGRRFKRAFEPGCSVGVLTRQLARCCDRVDAIDISPTAVAEAKYRCRECANTYITCESLLHLSSWAPFDLLIFSEVGYYFEEQTLRKILLRLMSWLEPSGTIVACHWLGQSADHRLSGDRVHEIIAESNELTPLCSERHPNFRLDCWGYR
jgi:trans-aconitate methyltransferase